MGRLSPSQSTSGDNEMKQELSLNQEHEGQSPSPASQKKELDKGELVALLEGCKLVDVALDIAAVVKMPKDTAILTTLGVVSSAVSLVYRTQYEHGGEIPVGLYVACEQPPSTGKSGLISMVQAPIFKDIQRVREINKQFAGFLTDTTPEGMEGTLEISGGLFMLASTEQTLIESLLGLSYKDKGGSNNNSLILEGYSGDWHSAARITRRGYTGNVHGSMTVISQDGTIDKILSSSNGTGIAERFFLFSEPDLLGTRNHEQKHRRSSELESSYTLAIKKLFDSVITKNQQDKAKLAEIRGLVLTNDPEADKDIQKQIDELCAPLSAFKDLHCLYAAATSWDFINKQKNEIEKLMGTGGAFDSSLMRSYAGKFDQRVLKLASVLHVIESLMNEKDVHGTIEHRYICMAAKLARWSNRQIYQIATDKGFIGKPAEYDAILNYMIRKKGPVKATDIKQRCKNLIVFKGKRESAGKAIEITLSKMVDDGYLGLVDAQSVSGRRSKQYEIVG